MDKKSKQVGSSDLGAFLRELGGRTYHLPRKLMKRFAQDKVTGYVWRDLLKPIRKEKFRERYAV